MGGGRFSDFLGWAGGDFYFIIFVVTIFWGVSLSPVWKEESNLAWMKLDGGGTPMMPK